jgi:D-amino-acid dehydrogenase
MKIAVLGAGVIGVSTAYALARLGHEVIVIDKAADVGQGVSFANGAQLSYSYTDPLASPSILKKLPGYLSGADKAMQLRFSARADYIRWGISFLRNCFPKRFEKNREARRDLSKASELAFDKFELDLKQKFEPTGQGKLVVAQSQSEFKSMQRQENFVSFERCVEIEPALKSWTGSILGGLYSPNDYALNTITYCQVLKRAAEENFGAKFVFNESVQNVEYTDGQLWSVITNGQTHRVEKLIICLGNAPNSLLKPYGIKVPIYPIQGYSLTLPIVGTSPSVSVTDLKNKVVYANLGDHMRIAGLVDVNQKPENVKRRIDYLTQIARQTWPNAADFEGSIDTWSEARPMMPSGVPIIGETRIDGLYLNLGHGSLGYTFAAGSAMKIAEIIGHAQKNTTSKRGSYSAA